MDLQLIEDLLGALAHGPFADHDAAHLGVTAQPEVVGDGAGQGLVELLMHHGNAVFHGLLGAFEVDFLPLQGDGAAVLGIDAEEALHQRGFARAVLSHQGVDGAGPDGQGDIVQGFDAGKRLADVSHFQQCRLIHIVFSSFTRTFMGELPPERHGECRSGRGSCSMCEKAGLSMLDSPALCS